MNRDSSRRLGSALHALHPLTKLVLTLGIVLVGSLAPSPAVPTILLLFLVFPVAAWGRIARVLARDTLALMLPVLVSLLLVQGFFYPGAFTVLFSLGPLQLKQEGVAFAVGAAARLALLTGAGLLLLLSTDPADLALALTQHGLPTSLSYLVITGLQLVPHLQARATAILDAQRARGLETQGSWSVRIRAVLPLVAPLVLSALVDVDERAMALQARAFGVTRCPTIYAELLDTRAQRLARRLIALATILLVIAEFAGWGR